MIVAKEKQYETLQELVKPHVESFNYLLQEGLHKVVKELEPVEFETPGGQRCGLMIEDLSIWSPQLPEKNKLSRTNKVYPSECRQRHSTYRGDINIQLGWVLDGKFQGYLDRSAGQIPIMVKSQACNLNKLSPKKLIQHGEEAEEMGGYYIINGQEKVVRMLILPRRNFPLCVKRPSWRTRGKNFTEYGVTIRCVRPDESAVNMTLHYASSGHVRVSFAYHKQAFYIPLLMLLKGLLDVEDQEIFRHMTEGREDSFIQGSFGAMMGEMMEEKLFTQQDMLQFLGERFRIKLNLPEWYTSVEIGRHLLKQCICVHLQNNRDKFNMMIYMTRKLLAFAQGQCCEESADNPMNQELLLSGHLMLMMLREKLEGWLILLKNLLIKTLQKSGQAELDSGVVVKACSSCPGVTRPLEYLLATGNLNSLSGLGLMQAAGLSVIADRLNFYRFLSHFRSVHRGAFFTQMRTTSVRKLLPEAWGFICPVHTPDGTPCGLLNHLTASCQAVNTVHSSQGVVSLLDSLGVCLLPDTAWQTHECYQVLLDGRVLGYVPDAMVHSVAGELRKCKVYGQKEIPPVLEICLVPKSPVASQYPGLYLLSTRGGGVPPVLEICVVPKSPVASQYPGLYLFSTLARMMRPVLSLQAGGERPVEMIGSFEQVYMDIAARSSEIIPEVSTHVEASLQSIFSVLGSLTPFSDHNPSPRNIYQCQMAKQTMGTPVHTYQHRADNKLYRLITPQTPVVRPEAHVTYHIDEYPIGTNAIIAVISATGYDMEDAIIINKASYHRGFAHGCVYKSVAVDLLAMHRNTATAYSVIFGCESPVQGLDSDGLPPVGQLLTSGSPMYSYLDLSTGKGKVEHYRGGEDAFVDQVKILGSDTGQDPLNHACLVLRVVRNPTIGDKFSSRHGQKGICSMLWPHEDMPFSESGMVPDICFNPHGFPSRMTIGMMIECMAGKSGALHGTFHDATPFTFSEDDTAIDFFGECLQKGGFNSLGTETMYCGETGREMEVQIFMGMVYYQRLRHMVSDKFQVRTTGPMDPLTMQPVQGRKRMGGIRFGEMERDGLISHGSSFLLHDRLFQNSDRSLSYLCRECGNLLSAAKDKAPSSAAAVSFEAKRRWRCLTCNRADTICPIAVPYVFKYLLSELAVMGIKIKLEVK
ncbi:hypothetical protein ACOMHN_052569 [Nucella lapillus]